MQTAPPLASRILHTERTWLAVSWQGVNDLSARPSGTGPNSNLVLTTGVQAQQTIILNTLGDLTNRENRFAYSRFANDFYNSATGAFAPDGIPDDFNVDNVPDVYPTFYPNVFNTSLINAPITRCRTQITVVPLLAFPYVFPGACCTPECERGAPGEGRDQLADSRRAGEPPGPVSVYVAKPSLFYLQNLNHNPLDVGDNSDRFLQPT